MNTLRIGLCCVLLLAGLSAGTAVAGPADWTGSGPFGGSVSGLHGDPLLTSRFYAYTSNGFFRSDDGASSWQLAENGLAETHPTTGIFVVDGFTANSVWLFDDYGRLYHSSDAGADWTATGFTSPVTLSNIYAPLPPPNALAQSAANTLWFAANPGGLYKSTDGGATFGLVGGTLAGIVAQWVAVNPNNPAQIVVGSLSGCTIATGNPCTIYVSNNGGSSWTASTISGYSVLPGILPALSSVAFGPAGSNRIYGLFGDLQYQVQLVRSDNNGTSWTVLSQNGFSLAVSPGSSAANDAVWVDDAKSTNNGVSFTALPSTGRTSNGVHTPTVTAIALAPPNSTTPHVLYGTYYGGMFLSSDGGTTWNAEDDGLAATSIRTVLVHPQDHTRLFAGYGDAGDPSPAFYRSTSAGTWSASNSGLNAYQLRTIAFDPTTTGVIGSTVIYGVGAGFDWVGGLQHNRNTGIYKSSDGGQTWANIGNGLPPISTSNPTGGHFAGILRTLITDPRSCAAPPPSGPCTTGPLQTLYVTGAGTIRTATGSAGPHQWRVMKSTDGGVNWASSENGLPADINNPDGSISEVGGVTPIVIDPSNNQTLYIGTFAEGFDSAGNIITPTVPSGVYKSIDGGANWVQTSTGLPTYPGHATTVYDTLSLAIDPNHPQTLWVSTVNANFNEPGQIYKTTNGGTSWAPSNAGVSGPDVRALLIDPTDSTVLYAASAGLGPANPGGVYKSTDSGATWSSISLGLPSNNSTALALDPVDPTVLYAGTSGGVYSITQLPDDDQDGVPDLIENAAPNGGDANHDGTPDAEQGNVSSTAPGLLGASGWQAGIAGISDGSRAKAAGRALQQLQAKPDANGTQGGYFSVQLVPGGGDCTHAVDVSAVLAGPLGVDSDLHHGTYTYPRGLLRFELPTCSTATAAISFNGATFGPGWSWRYYGPSTPGDNTTLGWHNASSLVQSQVGNAWTIGLAAGQFGSYRPSGVGAILFEGGPAYTDTVFRDKFE